MNKIKEYGKDVIGRGHKSVCLCGSTKFKEEYMVAHLVLSNLGLVVFTVECFMHADGVLYAQDIKEHLDDLHKVKIDVADEVLVLAPGGYIGESTKSEIVHAMLRKKRVTTYPNMRYRVPPYHEVLDRGTEPYTD